MREEAMMGTNASAGASSGPLDALLPRAERWLPREDQLRELLGGTFRALRRTDAGYAVDVTLLGEDRTFTAADPEEGYAAALLHLLAAAGL